MAFENRIVFVLWMKIASAVERLSILVKRANQGFHEQVYNIELTFLLFHYIDLSINLENKGISFFLTFNSLNHMNKS